MSYPKSKSYTLQEAKNALENYCIYQERCHQEVELKINSLNLIPAFKEEIILHLLHHDFLNEERFSMAFARGKFYIKSWGKTRIIRELKRKQITKKNIDIGLNEIDHDLYLSKFDELSLKRLEQIKELNKYKRRKKLADYLLYRGWESSMVYEKVMELVP